MWLTRSTILVLAVLVSSGCYFRRHTTKQASVPTLEPGTQLSIKTKEGRFSVHCLPGKLEGCEYDGVVWKRWKSYTRVKVLAGKRELTRGELRALAAPDDHEQRWKAVRDKRDACKKSAIPSWLAIASGAVAIAGSAWSYSERETMKEGEWTTAYSVTTVGLIGVAVGALASYPIGGRSCLAANSAMESQGIVHDDEAGYTIHDDDAKINYRDIERIVDRFNNQGGVRALDAADQDDPTEPSTEDADPEAP